MPESVLDKIHIIDLHVRCIVGINKWERTKRQDVLLNITLYADLGRACRTDRIEDTVDYKHLKNRIVRMSEESQYHLVEALAQQVADLCLEQPGVQKVEVNLQKPGALRFAKSVGIEIVREAHTNRNDTTAYIGVGSNIAPDANVTKALRLLQEQVRVTGISTFYRSLAVDGSDQPTFLNGVFEISTGFAPRPLKFELLREIEATLGRQRTDDRYGPRTIDLDILVYGDLSIQQPDLTVPDPDIRTRPFIAIPLLELAGDITLADNGDSLKSLPVIQTTDNLSPDHAFTESLKAALVSGSRSLLRLETV